MVGYCKRWREFFVTAIRRNVHISQDHRLRLDLRLPPEHPTGEAEVTVFVSPKGKPDKAKAIECLRQLSRLGGLRSVGDPSSWQRTVRADRPLPGRK